MKITLLDVEDYKKVKKVVIAPGEKNVLLIGGMNKQGKSSLIGAMTAALGGKGGEPKQPIREGQDHADIKIHLEGDDGSYQVHKRFLKSGSSSLKVTGKDGKISSPQKILDRIVGTRFLDPLAFSRLNEKEQRATLLKSVDLCIDLDKNAEARKEAFDERTIANREAKKAQVELDANPDPGEIEDADASALVEKVAQLTEAHSERQAAIAKMKNIEEKGKEKKEAVERLKKSLERASQEYEDLVNEYRAIKATVNEMKDVGAALEESRADLKSASANQEARTRKVAQKERHDRAKQRFKEKDAMSRVFTANIEMLDKERKEALENAKMPVADLTVGDDGLIYKGIPLSQASGAEQLTVSLALAAAMSPELKDIWVEDGALLDDTSLKLVEDFAVANDLRIWLERVGEGDDQALIMEEGSLRV